MPFSYYYYLHFIMFYSFLIHWVFMNSLTCETRFDIANMFVRRCFLRGASWGRVDVSWFCHFFMVLQCLLGCFRGIAVIYQMNRFSVAISVLFQKSKNISTSTLGKSFKLYKIVIILRFWHQIRIRDIKKSVHANFELWSASFRRVEIENTKIFWCF